MRWIQIENVSNKYIYKTYDLNKILDEFDVLHTLSIENAIDHIKEDDRKGKNI